MNLNINVLDATCIAAVFDGAGESERDGREENGGSTPVSTQTET